jgi:hypothetical protein
MTTPYRQGIEDYAAGRPFPPRYERWSAEAQHSYERGRLAQAAREAKHQRSCSQASPGRDPAVSAAWGRGGTPPMPGRRPASRAGGAA